MSATATKVDPYRSRDGSSVEIRERVDPVVWGSGEGPLDAVDLDAYERDGFLVVPELLGPEVVESCLAELERLAADDEVRAAPESILEPDGSALRSLFAVHRASAVFGALAERGPVVDIARQLLGSDVYVHQSRVNLKPGFVGKPFDWHSDFETWHVEDGMPTPRAVSCSIALTDNHSWNGALLVIAGSHRWYVSCAGITPEDHHEKSLRRQEYGVPDEDSLRWLAERGEIRDFTGPPGSVIFFDSNTMHGSPGNITPVGRTNAFVVFNSVDNALVDPFGTDRPRPEYIASRSTA